MKRPLLTVALLLAAGVLLGNWTALPPLLLFSTAFAVLIAAAPARRHRHWLLAALLVLAGWTNFTARNAVVSPHDLRRIVGEGVALATVEGRLAERPDLRRVERGDEELWRTLAVLEVSAVRLGNEWRRAHGRVAVTTADALSDQFVAGRHCRVTGVLGPPPGPSAEGLFDYRAHLARERIHFHLRARDETDWEPITVAGGPERPSLAERFSEWARAALARGLPEEDQTLRLLWAMSLGWRTALSGQVAEPFMRSGTMHIFAISGLHVAFVAGILVGLVRFARVPRRVCGLIVIPLLWFYAAATGWQSSAVRATIMMSVIVAGWALHRPGDLLNSIGAAAFLILLWQPEQLFQASFQLSFSVVASIALVLPPIERWQQRLLAPDPLLPPEARPRWQRWLDGPVRLVSTSFALSAAAWIGSLPLIAHYFHLFTPVSLLVNPFIVAGGGLALASCLGSLLCAGWLPWVAELFNHSGWFWMEIMTRLSEWSAAQPGAYWHVRAPSPWMLTGYYAVLLGLVGGRLIPRGRLAALAAGAVLVAGSFGQRWLADRGTVRMTILPAGGGDAILLQTPERRRRLLIDTGNESAAGSLVVPFLRAQGLNRLPALVLTHGDVRHVGGAPKVVDGFRAGEVIVSQFRFRSPVYRKVLDALISAPVPVRRIERGDRFAGWTVLHPQAGDQFTQADDAALVLRGEFHAVRVLLLSDLGRPGQRTLMDREADLRADIVVTGIPAQSEPLGDDLLERIQPRVVIVSAAESPATERPPAALRERLARANVPVVYTSDENAVTLVIRREGWEVRSMRGVVARGTTQP